MRKSVAWIPWLLVCLIGCRAPQACPQRALRCLPVTADVSAARYWSECQRHSHEPPAETIPKPAALLPREAPSQQAAAERQSEPAQPIATTATGSPQQAVATRPAPKSATIAMAVHTLAKPASPQDSIIRVAQQPRASGLVSAQPGQAEASSPSALDAQADDLSQPELVPRSESGAMSDSLQLPQQLPGAETPPLHIPPFPEGASAQAERERSELLAKIFPEIPAAPALPGAQPSAAEGVLGLQQLQEIARQNHAGLRAAAAAVEAARGQMVQAGLPPNPNVGYEADTVYTAHTQGYKGMYLQQTFITANKLGLAAQAAAVDYANAELDLRKEWITVSSEVRRQYFNALAARQRVDLATALLDLSERAYRRQIKLVQAGEAAPYEPLQLRVLATQARATLIQAQQDSLAAWRMLAAAVAVPALPPTALEGSIDCPVPEVLYEEALARLLDVHTDLRSARNLVARNRTLATLADRQPVPDVNVNYVLQHDYTTTPNVTTYNLQVGGALPVWNRNQGNRISTRAEVARAAQSVTNTQNDLIAQLAPVYARYQANRQLASSFKTDALRDQVRAYKGIYQRYQTSPADVNFNDVIVAQQTLAATLTQYLGILQAQWDGVVDLGELLQVDDIFQLGPPVPVARLPELSDDQ